MTDRLFKRLKDAHTGNAAIHLMKDEGILVVEPATTEWRVFFGLEGYVQLVLGDENITEFDVNDPGDDDYEWYHHRLLTRPEEYAQRLLDETDVQSEYADRYAALVAENAWKARLVYYPDVPREDIDRTEETIRSVLDETMTLSRELEGPPGWSVRKTGRFGRWFMPIETAMKCCAADLSKSIRRDLGPTPDEGDANEVWARRIVEYGGPEQAVVDVNEQALVANVSQRRFWTITRTSRGEPGWNVRIPIFPGKLFVSAVVGAEYQIADVIKGFDRIDRTSTANTEEVGLR